MKVKFTSKSKIAEVVYKMYEVYAEEEAVAYNGVRITNGPDLREAVRDIVENRIAYNSEHHVLSIHKKMTVQEVNNLIFKTYYSNKLFDMILAMDRAEEAEDIINTLTCEGMRKAKPMIDRWYRIPNKK